MCAHRFYDHLPRRAWPATRYFFSNLATHSRSVSSCLGVTPSRSAVQSSAFSDITASARATSLPAKIAYPPSAQRRQSLRVHDGQHKAGRQQINRLVGRPAAY